MNGVLETDPRQYPWCTPSSGGVACLNELIRNITEKRHVPWISKYCKPSCVHQDYQVETKAPLKTLCITQINSLLQTQFTQSQWPSEKYAIKVAESLGYSYQFDGENVTYKKYLQALATLSGNASETAKMKTIIQSIAQKFVKV